MKRLLLPGLALVCAACAGASPTVEAPASQPFVGGQPGPADRTFQIAYQVALADLPVGRTLRLWIPLPQDDAHQRITGLEVEAPWSVELRDDAGTFLNRLAYLEGPLTESQALVTVRYRVERWEHRADLEGWAVDGSQPDSLELYLQPSRRVHADARMRDLAEAIGQGASSTLARGRAFYDHVLSEMSYDKSGEGWGTGDADFACDVGRGNCTDFHAYFMALCLAAEIPARFQIGLFGDYDARPGEPVERDGYHCWAEFHVPGEGWVPVDISEADKRPELADYCFGGHTPNRVTLSEGRDLVLSPPQAGEPLNFFVDPYAEVDGQVHRGVSKAVTWTDEESSRGLRPRTRAEGR